jgi:hypothetical protein
MRQIHRNTAQLTARAIARRQYWIAVVDTDAQLARRRESDA